MPAAFLNKLWIGTSFGLRLGILMQARNKMD
jgi:hypothetical protein